MSREMKHSGIEWIGEIPKEWDVSKIGNLYHVRNEKVSDKDYPPLSVTMNGIVPQLETAAKTNNGDDRKLVCKGDFAINSRSDRRGSCGVSQYDGSVSLINTILTPRTAMNPQFYNWLFHTELFADEFYKWGHGIVNDLWTTRWQEMKNISIVLPSLTEQQKIANYLDKVCGEVDEMIALQEQMIEELKAYKQSVITEAVTKGLNPNVPMKDSGIDWIGKIPEHWGIERFKSQFNTGKGLNITKGDLKPEGVPVVSYGQIHSKMNTGTGLNECLIRHIPIEFTENGEASKVSVGDFIFADTSEDIIGCGNAVYIDKEIGIYAGYHSVIAFAKHLENSKYLSYLFLTDCWRSQIRMRVTGIKVFSISQAILRKTTLLLPPLSEQQAIASYLDSKCSEIDALIAIKQSKIEELKEYKKSVIYEYVTGKKEVV